MINNVLSSKYLQVYRVKFLIIAINCILKNCNISCILLNDLEYLNIFLGSANSNEIVIIKPYCINASKNLAFISMTLLYKSKSSPPLFIFN